MYFLTAKRCCLRSIAVAVAILLLNAMPAMMAAGPTDSQADVAHHPPGPKAGALPMLTTADQVLRLEPDEAQRGYPVKIQGVVTCVVEEHNGFLIQDSTRAVFVRNSLPSTALPRRGERLEIEGQSDKGSFAPLVRLSQLENLGAGTLPQAVEPSWDQLMNGSLDDQLVEIRGVVEEVVPHPKGYPESWSKMSLRTLGGTLQVDVWLVGTNFENLEHYEDAVVRLRGCLFVTLSPDSPQLERGHIRMYVDAIKLDEPAPVDEFSAPQKRAAELTLFDPRASAFQRVKVSGVILYTIGGNYFMMDGTNGVRFTLRRPADLHTGDQVEAVGYPELSGAAPLLRFVVARKTGHAKLPKPQELSPDDLPNATYDSTRVRIEGWLVSSRTTPTNRVMEIEAGSWRFLARETTKSPLPPVPRIGSRLALIGVYVAQGGNRLLGDNAAPFDLLLHTSPADVVVLSQPSWWTLERLLVVVGALVCALAILVLWVTQLHRQVEERSAELESQIHHRQRVEHQRAMEQERARIARDLHDELGSGITEISMLADRARATPASDGKRTGYVEQMGESARQMVTALDEIVWAMNPEHDSLSSLVSYFCLYAERFLGLANIAWRLEKAELPDQPLDFRHRHQLFLAFKEALNNIVRHSGATEVSLRMHVEDGELWLSINDNGRGLPAGARTADMDGVANMRARVEKLGGRFEIVSEAGHGTTVQFRLPAK
jgi:signal transduction histidine kinase